MTEQKHIDVFMVGFEAGSKSAMLCLGHDEVTTAACVRQVLDMVLSDPLAMLNITDAIDATLDGRPYESSLDLGSGD